MVNNYTNLNDLFTDMAKAIRTKKDGTESINAYDFPKEIEGIKNEFDYNNQAIVTIPDYAFYNCEDLKNVNCLNITSIGASAFENCTALKTIILYDDVKSVGENAFKGCSNLTIYCEAESKPDTWSDDWNPDNCTVVWGYAPVETWDVSATKEDNVIAKLYNDINKEGFYILNISGRGRMKDYNSNDMPWYVSRYHNKISSTVITGVLYIGNSALSFCKITSATIDNSTISIGHYAFQVCSSLISIVIPDSVTSIGNEAFYGCLSLKSIIYVGTIAQWNTITFGSNWNGGRTGNYTIHCTDGTIAKDGTITYYNA